MKREDWVRRTARRCNKEGPGAMKDERRNSGVKLLLTEDDMPPLTVGNLRAAHALQESGRAIGKTVLDGIPK